MSLLSSTELIELVSNGVITRPGGIQGDDINAASIDLHLGRYLKIENPLYQIVSLKERTKMNWKEWDLLEQGPYILQPGEFILAQSEEEFNLPSWVSSEYKLKSSMARIGLEHLTAGWCDSGWHGSVLTLELKNLTRYAGITLDAGVAIGQMIFFKHTPVPTSHSYSTKGRYNNDKKVETIKE